jgi:hypothetical protein
MVLPEVREIGKSEKRPFVADCAKIKDQKSKIAMLKVSKLAYFPGNFSA